MGKPQRVASVEHKPWCSGEHDDETCPNLLYAMHLRKLIAILMRRAGVDSVEIPYAEIESVPDAVTVLPSDGSVSIRRFSYEQIQREQNRG